MKFKPVQGKVLISPLKEVKVTRTTLDFDEESKNKIDRGGDLRGEELKKIKVKSRTPANFQIAKVLAVPTSSDFMIGETVIYNPKYTIKFDLIKGALLVDAYGIVGQWVEPEYNPDININL